MARRYWTKEEEDYILNLMGLYPLKEIVRRVRKWINVEVTSIQVGNKVKSLAKREYIKLSDMADNYTPHTWGKLLGIRKAKIYRWITKGLRAIKAGNNHMISHGAMVSFAKRYPSLLQSIERKYLEWLFDDEKGWVDIILNSKPCYVGHRPVLCVTTNTTYGSLTKAAKANSVTRMRLTKAVNSGIPLSNGTVYLAFRYAD